MDAQPKNVILLTADALRADHLSHYGYERQTTPFLDSLAEQNTTFRNAFSPSSHTREAVPSLLTGQSPQDAVDQSYRLASDSVATRLADSGIRTAAFHSNPFISRAYGFDESFDTFDDDLYLGKHRLVALFQRAFDKLRNRHYARADEINERSLEWLDSLGEENFFLWNHYMDTHGPYEPPKAYQRKFRDGVVSDREAQRLFKRAIQSPESITEEEQSKLVDLYDAEIRYFDDQVAELFSALEERGLLEDTLVIFTSDHGEAFGEHDYYEHPRFLHEELVHVPLVTIGESEPTKNIETAVSLVDLVPTILDVLGGDSEGLPGTSLRGSFVDDPDRDTVFLQARGEGEDSNLRRFSARTSDAASFLERDVQSGEIDTEHGDETLLEELREYSARQTEAADERGVERDTTADVDRRLEALGYKER